MSTLKSMNFLPTGAKFLSLKVALLLKGIYILEKALLVFKCTSLKVMAAGN